MSDPAAGYQKFPNRAEAGRVLGLHLLGLARENPVVVALPRGGVPVALEVARQLRAPMELFVVRKIGLPGHPELAMGAIGEGGGQYFDTELMRRLGVSRGNLEPVEEKEQLELERRVAIYQKGRKATSISGRPVIIVDDGAATGTTARVAIDAMRAKGASRVIVAVPVASSEAIAELRQHADEVVSVLRPTSFAAVGQWYRDFAQLSDRDVMEMLDSHG